MMKQASRLNPCKDDLFNYLLILTGFFFLIEICFFIQTNRGYLSDYTFVSDHLYIPNTILPGVMAYLAVSIGIHLMFSFFAWLISKKCIILFSISKQKQLSVAICIWTLFLIAVLAANQYFYPNSKFSRLTSLLLLSTEAARVIFYFFSILSSIVIFFGLVGLVCSSQKRYRIGLMLVFISTIYFIFPHHKTYFSNADSEHPNIILMGVDSLRPDFIEYMGGEASTPFFNSFLEKSVVFSEATTPLARTFPSWMSILNGLHPRELNIRTNLTNVKGFSFASSLPTILKAHGYETIYASDETRFSNIDQRFGFNQIITPPMGLNDFLLGSFNDFPLTNVILNSLLGDWLLPYSYANRAVFFSYEPNQFIARLSSIVKQSHSKPLFLAVHFCLPHHPYLYASLNGEGVTIRERYVASITRVDKQLKQFYRLLSEAHLLDHSIVVLLSDHGEALALPGDRITEPELFLPKNKAAPMFYPHSGDGETMDQSAGHGTDVLGLPQYHTLLAFQLNGVKQLMIKPHFSQGVVSLLDIKQTILSILQIPYGKSSGISLLPAISNPDYQLPKRHLMLESDFSPAAIRTVYPEIREVMLAGIDLFEIDARTTRLTVKPSMVAKIIQSKQYADIYDEWMLALYPRNKKEHTAILINLNSGYWTDDLNSAFALTSPAVNMMSSLKSFYGSELGETVHG